MEGITSSCCVGWQKNMYHRSALFVACGQDVMVCNCVFLRARDCFAKSAFLITEGLSIRAVNLKPFAGKNISTAVNLKGK